MMLMRRLLVDAQGQFRKMMADNQALATRIDHDIHSAHVQVSALRAELADTNLRIHNITNNMAGNVITTCMPPTNTTNTPTIDTKATRNCNFGEEGLHSKLVTRSAGDGHRGQGSFSPGHPLPHTRDSPKVNSPKKETKDEKTSVYGSVAHSGRLYERRSSSPSPKKDARKDTIDGHRGQGGRNTNHSQSHMRHSPNIHSPKRDTKVERCSNGGSPTQAGRRHDHKPDTDSSPWTSKDSGKVVEVQSSSSSPTPSTGDINKQTDAIQSEDSMGRQDSTDSDSKDLADTKIHSPNVNPTSALSESPRSQGPSVHSESPRSQGLSARSESPRSQGLSALSESPRSQGLSARSESPRSQGLSARSESPRSQGLSALSESPRSQGLSARSESPRIQGLSARSDSPRSQGPSLSSAESPAKISLKSSGTSTPDSCYRDQAETSTKLSICEQEVKGDQEISDTRTVQMQNEKTGLIDFNSGVLSELAGSPKSVEEENVILKHKCSTLQRDFQELQAAKDISVTEHNTLTEKVKHLEKEFKHAKEALTALKQDRKRLKAEKFDLLTQMKQLYSTLEDKEKELREFIRNYEQKMKDTDEKLKKLTLEREESEKEKWNILKRARDEGERSVALCTQLGLKDSQIRELQEEISSLRDRGISSDAETRTLTNGYGSPASTCYRMSNGVDPRDTPTPTLSSDPITSSSYGGTPTITIESPQKVYQRMGTSDDHRPLLLSRSAEDIFNSSGAIDDSGKKMTKCKERKGTWGSISRVFSRSRQRRKTLDPGIFEGSRTSWSPKSSVTSSPLSEESYMQKLRLLEESRGTPMEHWRASTVLAWLEVTMDMTKYSSRCCENIKSGKVLLELSESEMEDGLGITNVMHRRKLRLAIDEHREPSLCPYPKICQMTHSWVIEEWLPSIALSLYLPSFSEHLVDGRVLNTLTKKDLEKYFGITHKFHLLSIVHAIQLLRIMHFDRQIISQRRLNCENMDVDPLVWSSQRLIKWVRSIDLGEYAENLRHSGVHGALMVLEPSFTAETLAAALGIPSSKNIIRRHLTTEFQNLVQPARLSLESERVVARKSEKRLGSSGSTFGSQGKINSIVPSYARRTLDRPDKRRSSWRFSTWKSSQESLKSTASSSKKSVIERPRMLPLSPQLMSTTPTPTTRHRRTFSSHSDVETLTVTPV